MLDCLANLIGLTDKDCDCYNGSQPEGFEILNESETGYYLTDEDYGFPILDGVYASIDCGDPDNVFSVLDRARTSARNAIYTDLQAAMLQVYDKTVHPLKGLVGQRRASGTRTVNASTTTIGQLWRPKAIKDAAFNITHIWLGVNQTGNVQVTISSNDPDFVTYNQTFAVTTAGVFQKFALTTPVELPFFSRNTDEGSCCGSCGLQYSISYAASGGLKPLDNKYSCCGGNNTEWRQYVDVNGFETDDLAGLLENCGQTKNSYGQGMAIEGYLSCDNLNWLCELEELNGLDLRDVLARAMQYKGTVFLTKHILDSNNINFWTTLNREAIYGKRNHAEKRFTEILLWIAQNVPSGMTGCYKCKPANIQRRSF